MLMSEASTSILFKIQGHHPTLHKSRRREKESAVKAMVIPVESCICQLNASLHFYRRERKQLV